MRQVVDDRFGALSGSVNAFATSLTSPDFSALPSGLSTVRYVPLVLADDSLKVYEVVWVTSHSEGSQTITVVRGREGSAARSWGTGSLWRCGPTTRDVVSSYANRAALPTDAHLGMRAALIDEVRVVEKVNAGWKDTAAIFGHAGRTAGFQAGGVVALTAAQDLQGGMTFVGGSPSGSLVVPVPGRYLVTIRGYVSGGTIGRYTAATRVNGNVASSGPAIQAWKGDGVGDHSNCASSLMTLAAGDAVTFAVTLPNTDQTWGTTGYDGAYLELLYIGP